VFWDHKRLLLVDFLGHGDTVTAECYFGTLEILQAFSLKQPGVLCQGGFTLYKNIRPSTANQTCEWLPHCRWEVMDHHPYSPNHIPSDFYFRGHLKQHLASKKFATHANMKQGVTFWLHTLHTDFFYAGIQASERRWWENAEISVVTIGSLKCTIHYWCTIKSESSSQHHSVCCRLSKNSFV